MSEETRRRASALMRDALALLDVTGEQRATLHLQLALDLLDEASSPDRANAMPTCH